MCTGRGWEGCCVHESVMKECPPHCRDDAPMKDVGFCSPGQACFAPGNSPAGQGMGGGGGLGTDIPLQRLGNRGSLVSTASSASKPSALASLANLISDPNPPPPPQRVRVSGALFSPAGPDWLWLCTVHWHEDKCLSPRCVPVCLSASSNICYMMQRQNGG